MTQKNSLIRYFIKKLKTYYLNRFILTILICHLINSPILGQKNVDKFKLYPIPSWVKQYPVPVAKSNYKLDLVFLQLENQYNHITKESFHRNFYYLNTAEGRNKISSLYVNYNPLFNTLKINKVTIYRKNNIINLDDQLHVEHKLENTQIGGTTYSNDVQVSIFLNQAKAGDIVEFVYTIVGNQPDLYGTLNGLNTLNVNELRGKSYFRIITSGNKPINYDALNTNVKPKIENFNGLTAFEFILTNHKTLNKHTTPAWYSNEKEIYIYDNNSWKEVNDLYLKNFELDNLPSDTIRNKVYELTNNLITPQEKINAILNYTQDIFYLDYGLIDPKEPEVVIQQGFGDCKSKSLLTIKMLECLNINSWPVIVKNTGLDERLLNTYSPQVFNHAIVEFIFKNDTIPFDSTLEPQKGTIYQKYVPNFRYGLRVIKNNTKLSKLKEYSDQKFNLTATISETNISNENSINWKINFKGNLANVNNFISKEKGVKTVFNSVSRDLIRNPFWNTNDELNYSISETEPSSTLTIKPVNDFRVFKRVGNGNQSKFFPRPLYEWLQVINSDQLGAYFSLPDFKETTQLFKFKVSNAKRFQSDSTLFENDWIKYSKKVWKEKDTVYASYKAKILKSDLEASRYDDVATDIKFLKEDMGLDLENSGFFIRNENIIFALVIALLVIGVILFPVFKIFRNRKKHRKIVSTLNNEIENLKLNITKLNIKDEL